jgi:hypothetical protein
MSIYKEHFDFDPAKFTDEMLVIMSRCGSVLAVQALMDRYYEWVKRKIRYLAGKKGLPFAG